MSVDESLLCSFQILKPASKKKKRESKRFILSLSSSLLTDYVAYFPVCS